VLTIAISESFSNSISSSFLIASEAICTRGVTTSTGQPDRLISATSSGSASSNPSSSDSALTHSSTVSTSSHKSDSSSSSHGSSTSSLVTSVGLISTSSTGAPSGTSGSGLLGPSPSSSSAKRAGFTWDLGILGMGLGMVLVI
jgi:hypothetical protein